MLRKKVLMLFFSLLIFVIPVFASVNLIEKDIGDYNYISTRLSYWNPIISERNVSNPVYNLKYNSSEGQSIYVQVIEFDDDTFGKNYLSTWISDKTKENQSLVYNNNYLFKYHRSRNNLIWRYKNFYILIGLNDDYSNFPNEIIEAYLEIYPSDCSEDECPNTDMPIEEQIYNKFFLGYNEYTSGLFFKYNGFSIRCRNIVKYGKDGATKYSDLDYNSFKAKINEYLSDSMYFSEDELNQLYDGCIEEEVVEIGGLPLDGFLKDCYERVYPKLEEEIELGHKIDETSLSLCDNINLIIIKNNEFFEELKEERGPEIIDQIIDFIVQKKLEKIEQEKQACRNWKEGDEPITGCDYHKEENGNESIIRLKPCTEEDLKKGLECIPVKEVDDKKLIEKEETKTEEKKEKQSENVFVKIISFFKRLFS